MALAVGSFCSQAVATLRALGCFAQELPERLAKANDMSLALQSIVRLADTLTEQARDYLLFWKHDGGGIWMANSPLRDREGSSQTPLPDQGSEANAVYLRLQSQLAWLTDFLDDVFPDGP